MNYLSESREERRERARIRMMRARAEKLRKIKIYSCMGAISAIVLVLIAWCVFSGGSDSDMKNTGGKGTVDLMASVNATEEQNRDDGPNINIIEPESSTENETYEYGDSVYSDGEFIVCIDAGHGGNDVGCEGSDGTYEKDDDLKLAMLVKYQLSSMGVTVIMTRSADVRIELEDRAHIANQSHADVFVSIHRNATDRGSAKGFEAWVNSEDSDNSYDLASIIMSKLENVGISDNRGVKMGTMESKKDNYKINCLSSMPSVLLEMGFMSSPTDNRLFKENLTDYAKAIAEAILQWSESQPY